MSRGLRNILLMQVLLVVLAAVIVLFWRGHWSAVMAAGYGGAIALGNTLLSARRVRRANAKAAKSAVLGTVTLYAGMVERFIFTLVAFGLGMGKLGLYPPALLLAFAFAQLGYLAAGFRGAGPGGGKNYPRGNRN